MNHINNFIFRLILIVLFANPIFEIHATPSYDELKSDLDSGGIKRQKAIWYVYQHNQFELLPYIAEYLNKKESTSKQQLAVLHAMSAYKDNLERYLPNWPKILDKYINKELPEKNLLKSIAIINFFKESRMIHSLLRLTDDTRSSVRLASYQSIHNLGNDRLIPVLLKLAHHKRAIFRLYALEAMTKFQDNRLLPTIQKSLRDESKSVRIYAILALARQPSGQNVSYNAGNQFSKEKNPEVRRRVVEVIRQEKWRNLIYLVHKGISDQSGEVRKESLLTVLALNNKSASSFIARQLPSEKNSDLIVLGMNTLCFLKNTRRNNGLRHILKNHKNYKLRARAAFSIGYLKDRSGLSALKDSVVFDKSVDVRVESAWALGHFRDGSSSRLLQKVVRNKQEDYRVRSASFLALKKQNSHESRRLLQESIQLVESNHLSLQIKKVMRFDRK